MADLRSHTVIAAWVARNRVRSGYCAGCGAPLPSIDYERCGKSECSPFYCGSAGDPLTDDLKTKERI